MSSNGNRRALGTAYAAGVVQGMALVTFPAAGTILTSPTGYALSGTQYGLMFAPQVICAIGASLLGAEFMNRAGPKRIYHWGLFADLASMALLFGSRFAVADPGLAYSVLLVATAWLGVGFGLTVPALNTVVAALFGRDPDPGVLALNALLGLGTVLAPALIALFVGVGMWYGLPAVVALLAIALLVLGLPVTPPARTASPGGHAASDPFPRRFWLFAAAAFLYGIVETMSGNWTEVFMTQNIGASAALASVSLTTFWAAVTGGRLGFAALDRWLPPSTTYRILPFLSAVALVLVARLERGAVVPAVLAFGFAGLSCSALLPLTISFAQEQFTSLAQRVAGVLIAFYQGGYGLAAFGVGPLESAKETSLSGVFGSAALVAAGLGVLALFVAGPRLGRIRA